MPERKLFTPEDIKGFTWVSDAQISPDSTQFAWVQTWVDDESNEYRAAIYIASTIGEAQPRRFTYGQKRDSHPRWSPDGSKLLFISDRDDTNQVYVIDAHGGEARKITSLENGASSAEWSPDNSKVAFISTTDVKVKEDIKEIVSYHYVEAEFKHDGEGIKRGRNHLFVQAIESAEATQLTSGEDDYSSPTWSPDGKHIAVVSSQDAQRPFVSVSDVYLMPVGGGEPRRITPGKGPSFGPSFSPDGSKLAYIGHDNPPDTGLSTNMGVWTVSVEGGEPQRVTEGWDRSVGNDVNSDCRMGENANRAEWSADGTSLYFLGGDRGASHIFTAPSSGGEVRPVTSGNRVVEGFSVAGERMAFVASEMLAPSDIYTVSRDGSSESRLTCVNREYLDQFVLSPAEAVVYTSADGTALQGWVIKPVGFRDGERYPLILEVHGGPHTAYGYSFFHEFQVLAAQGYGVMFTNPRGSTGHGQQFMSCIVKNWGELDYQDVIAAADLAVAQPWVDSERTAIIGGSYGGFMTNWVVGHTDRFKAAITLRCLSNWASFYGTSDIGPAFAEWHVGGTPWDNPEGYARLSPITYVKDVKTPLLVMHSEQDHRCPVEQGEQMFVAVKRLGIDSEFVRFPQESHGMSRGGTPKRRIERLHRILGWFDRYLVD